MSNICGGRKLRGNQIQSPRSCKAGVANPRPAGRMRPALNNFMARRIHNNFTKFVHYLQTELI